MKSVKFRGIKYTVGDEISTGTPKKIGFYFNRYEDIPNDDVSWYFIRIDESWLASPGWIEYYVETEGSSNILKFYDSIESDETFSEHEDEYAITYYRALTLKDTLKEL